VKARLDRLYRLQDTLIAQCGLNSTLSASLASAALSKPGLSPAECCGSTTTNLRTAAAGEQTTSTESTKQTRSRKVTTRQTERILNRTEWATATTVDTLNAGSVTFDVEIGNEGTDVARSINSILVNCYIGDSDDVVATVDLLGRQATSSRIANLFPGQAFRVASSVAITLSLDEIRRLDLGEGLHLSVVRVEFGDDQLFYENAYAGGVLVQVDNGVDDGTEEVESFLIPTWTTESYLSVLARAKDMLKFEFDEHQNLRWIDLPVFDAQRRITSTQRLANKANARWVVYTQTGDAAVFTEKAAKPETTILLKYVKDEDGDGFTDVQEFRAGTNPRDAASFPTAGLRAGYVEETGTDGKLYTSVVVENTGTWPAAGVELSMYSPDGAWNITRNASVGGGVIRAGQKVVIGPRYVGPNLSSWTGDAKPMLAGIYRGTNEITYTFTVLTNGNVGSATGFPTVRAAWGASQTTNFTLGSAYAAPAFLTVGTDGLQVAFISGFLKAGESFTITAQPWADAFARLSTPASTNAVAPGVVLSYNTPQGNRRLTVTKRLNGRTDALTGPSAARGTSLALSALSLLQPGTNTLHTRVFCAEPAMTNARVVLELIDPSRAASNVVWSQVHTQTLAAGYNYVNASLNPANALLGGALVPGQQYYLLGTLTDAVTTNNFGQTGGNVIDQTLVALGVPLSTNSLPVADLRVAVTNFGSITNIRGTTVIWTVQLANIGQGAMELLIAPTNPYVSTTLPANWALVPPGASLVVQVIIDTSSLPPGSNRVSVPITTTSSGAQRQFVLTGDVLVDATSAKVAALDFPGKPWTKTLLVTGPVQANEILAFDLSGEFNELGFFPVGLKRADGTIVGGGKYTSYAGGAPAVWSSALKPSRVFVRLPDAVAANQTSQYVLEIGMLKAVVAGAASFGIKLPATNFAEFHLNFLPVRQRLLSAPFEYEVNASDTASALLTRSGKLFSLQGRPPGGGRPGTSSAQLLMSESPKAYGIRKVEIEVASAQNSEGVFGFLEGGGFKLPSGTNRVIMQFDSTWNTCTYYLNGVSNKTVTVPSSGFARPYIDAFGAPAQSVELKLLSWKVDDLEIIDDGTYSLFSSAYVGELFSSASSSANRRLSISTAPFYEALKVNGSGTESAELSVPWGSSFFSKVELLSTNQVVGNATGVSPLKKTTYSGFFDDVSTIIADVNLSFSGPDGTRSGLILTTNTIAAHTESTLLSKPIDFSNLVTDGVARFAFNATGADGALVAISGLSYSTAVASSDLRVTSVSVDGGVGGQFSVGTTANLRATVALVGPV